MGNVINLFISNYTGTRIVEVRVTHGPTKTSYKVGEMFDASGIELEVEYSDGHIEPISDFIFEPSGALTITDTIITIKPIGVKTSRVATIQIEVSKNKVAAPSAPSYALTYTGGAIHPQWSYNDELITISGDISGINIGNYETIFTLNEPEKYEWTTGGSDAIIRQWTIAYEIIRIAIPTVGSGYTYNGNIIYPVSGYDADKMTYTGTYSATNAGDYTITFSLKSVAGYTYVWTDNTIEPKQFNWKINKAQAVLSGLPSTLSLMSSAPATIQLSTNFDSNIIISPTISEYMTINYDSTTKILQLTYKSDGSQTIEASIVGTDNWFGTSVTCSVTSTSYNANFSSNTWEQIIDACQKNAVPDTWLVGDYKMMSVGGTDYQIDIIGKNHDKYSEKEGFAPLTFQFHDCYAPENYLMGPNGSKWSTSNIRTSVLVTILGLLPSVAQQAIQLVEKTSYIPGASEDTDDKLFLLSNSEVSGTTQFFDENQYEYYQNHSKVKYRAGSTNSWWLRSMNIYSSSLSRFYYVNASGTITNNASMVLYGVAPAFCF